MGFVNLSADQKRIVIEAMHILTDASESGEARQVYERFAQDEAMATAFSNYLIMEDCMDALQDAIVYAYPDARFWQIATIKVALKRSQRALEAKQSEGMTGLPTYGIF